MEVLGIDAGGSKTVALLAGLDGRVIAEGRGGGANLRTHGELAVEKTLHNVIDQVLEAYEGEERLRRRTWRRRIPRNGN